MNLRLKSLFLQQSPPHQRIQGGPPERRRINRISLPTKNMTNLRLLIMRYLTGYQMGFPGRCESAG
jgi:hypothetical protein